MPRAATAADPFDAIADPRRRQIVELLAKRGALPVGDVVESLKLPQPAVSKHLSVLRQVGIVSVTKQGKQRVYNLEPAKLKAIFEWVRTFEALWSHQLIRIKQRAERRAQEATATPSKPAKGS